MKKLTLITLVIIPLLLIIGIIIYFGFLQQSLIGLPVVTKSFSFDGINGIAESPTFSSLSNDRTTPFCDSNDGDVTISNSLTDGNELILSSYLSSERRACNENYVRTTLSLPSGKLSGNCELISSDDNFNDAHASCKIDNKYFYSQAGSSSTGGSFEINIDTPRSIDIIIISSGVDNANANAQTSATLILNFEKTIVYKDYYRLSNNNCITINLKEGTQLSTDYETLSECQNNIIQDIESTYYRFSNNNCNQIQLYSSEVTSNDYITLSECQSHIVQNTKSTYYRFSNNNCNQIQLYSSEVTSNDYATLQECQSKITQDGDGSSWDIERIILTSFIILPIILVVVIIIYIATKPKKKN